MNPDKPEDRGDESAKKSEREDKKAQEEFAGAETAPASPQGSPQKSTVDGVDGLSSGGFFEPPATGDGDASHPERIGPYRILEVLGQGGMGVVYLAMQMEPVRREVALKLIKLGMDTKEVVARFESERQALALMNHAAIARVYDGGATEGGRPYFVMERVAGEPITAYCDRQRLTVADRLRLFVRVCEGVQHAHQRAIIHRDIKPSNILVAKEDGSEATPRIIDFGVAKATRGRLGEHSLETLPGQVIGTPAYMSPEQAAGDVGGLDTRTDIYSLGVLLYEILTGVLPFESAALRQAGFAEIQRVISEEEPLKPSTRLSTLREELKEAAARRSTEPRALKRQFRGDLDWITLKALEKDRERRYATVAELAEDIRRHLRHDPVIAGPPGLAYRARKFVRKHRGPLVSIAAVLAVVVGFVAVSWYQGEAEFRDHVRAVRQALDGSRLVAAQRALVQLEESWPDSPTVVGLAREVEDLDYRERVAESRALRESGQEEAESFSEFRGQHMELERQLEEAETRNEKWYPPWMRLEEIQARRDVRSLEQDVTQSYNDTVVQLSKAMEKAPPESEEHLDVRKALERMYFERYQEADKDGHVSLPPDFFKRMIETLEVGTFARELVGSGTITVTSEPSGAEVFCFRYKETVEEYLTPWPFDPEAGKEDPEKGLLARPFLVIEHVEPHATPFQPGDRLLEIEGHALSLRGDLARALEGVALGASVKVTVRRKGKDTSFSWVPFAQDPAGAVVDILGQFGFTCAGYPLDVSEERCRLGVTGDAPVSCHLPRGSYLFLLRKEGYLDARLPVVVPSSEEPRHVRLFRPAEVPDGFVPISAGSAYVGGDREAYMSLLPGREEVVGDFFLRRLEVTFDEYGEFLSDPDVFDRTVTDSESGTMGTTTAEADWSWDLLKGQESRKIQLIPIYEKEFLYHPMEEAKQWKLVDPDMADWAVFSVSLLAALEYAHWRTEKEDPDGWRYRLPSDLEWEKAARGVDRRLHVWGNQMAWTFCRSVHGRRLRLGAPDPVGLFPLDESVYGVRDLGGSVSEFVLARAAPDLDMCVHRGGSWYATDPRDYHIPTRNRQLPHVAFRFVGIRLAADVKE